MRQNLADAAAKIPKLRSAALPEDLQNDLSRIDRQYLTRLKGLDAKERRQYQVHAQVFEAVGRQLAPARPGTAPSLDTFQASAGAVDRQTGELVARITALPPEGAVVGDRLQQVCALGKTLAEWAARRQRYDLVDAALAVVPTDAAAFAARVRAAGAAGPAPKYPVVLMAKQQGGDEVAPEYRPQAARSVLAGWRTLGSYLEPPQPQGGGDRILDREKLVKRFDATRQAARQYAAAYCGYWNEQVPARAKVSVGQWSEFFRDGERPRTWKAWEANAALKELVQLAATALGELEAAAPMWKDELQTAKARERYQAVLAQFDETLFQRECDKVLLNWRSLARDAGYDPLAARDLILAMKPDAWRDQLLFGSSAGGIAVQYWADLTFELTRSLRVAATSSQKALADGVEALRGYDRFPLAPLRAGRALSPDEVNAARKIRDRIVAMRRPLGSGSGSGAVLASSATSLGQAIARGATKEYGRFDDELRQLRGQDIPEQDARWVERVGRVLDALPADGALECAVWVAGNDERSRLANSRRPDWYSVTLQQQNGAAPGAEVQVFPLPIERQKLGSVRCPGSPIEFWLYRNPTHERERPVKAGDVPGGEWQALGLLHARGAQPLPDGKGRRWYVELPLPRGERVLGLVLEFDREIPRLEDWPSAPAKAPPGDAAAPPRPAAPDRR
jgi:hypothetical protein